MLALSLLVVSLSLGHGLTAQREGRFCNAVSDCGAHSDGKTDTTKELQTCLDSCETLFLPGPGVYLSGALTLRSHQTLSVGGNATLLGSTEWKAYDMRYTRTAGLMREAHAGLLNGAQCLKMKVDSADADQCDQWGSLKNITIEGPGVIDGQGAGWWEKCRPTCPDGTDADQRPSLLQLLWIHDLRIRNIRLQNSPFWTVHPTFCDGVVVENVNIYAPSNSHNTDGIDPDSTKNVHIHDSTIDTGDDCIAIKSGKDWSGRQVNISTENILVERMTFLHGHGVAIGSETSGSVRNVTIRDSVCSGTDKAVRIKSQRGRGGVVENILYSNLTITEVSEVVSITMEYSGSIPPTNATATPVFRNITVRNVSAHKSQTAGEIVCLDDSPCHHITFDSVDVARYTKGFSCENAYGSQHSVSPDCCLKPEQLMNKKN